MSRSDLAAILWSRGSPTTSSKQDSTIFIESKTSRPTTWLKWHPDIESYRTTKNFDVLEVTEPAYIRLEAVLNLGADIRAEDWRGPIKQFLINPSPEADAKLRR